MKKHLASRLLSVGCICFILLTVSASAHPGKTDADGGHYDKSTGEYHFHHGYPAHQHENGICPYDSPVQASSDIVSTNTTDNAKTSPSEQSYEAFYNLGYSDAAEDILRVNDYNEDMRTICENVLDSKLLTGNTALSSNDDAMQSAYDEGYKAAVTDISFEVQLKETETDTDAQSTTDQSPAPTAVTDKTSESTLFDKMSFFLMLLGIAEIIALLTRFFHLWRISRPSVISIGLSSIFNTIATLTLLPIGLMSLTAYLNGRIEYYHHLWKVEEERRKEEHLKAVEAGTELHTLDDLNDIKDKLFR